MSDTVIRTEPLANWLRAQVLATAEAKVAAGEKFSAYDVTVAVRAANPAVNIDHQLVRGMLRVGAFDPIALDLPGYHIDVEYPKGSPVFFYTPDPAPDADPEDEEEDEQDSDEQTDGPFVLVI